MTTQKLCRAYVFRIYKTSFEFTPKHKFNFIIDESATGKSYLVNKIAHTNGQEDVYAINGSNIALFNPCTLMNKLIVIDEVAFMDLMTMYTWKDLQKSTNVYAIVSRHIPSQLSVDYRAVYTLQYKNDKYTLKNKYDYLQELKPNSNYIVEDSRSGYQYFSSKLNNVETANGKDNIPMKDLSNTTVIADGSAFAHVISLLEASGFDLSNLFLPESFEGLIISNNASNLANKIYENAYTDVVLDYKSIEDYFEHAIKLLYKDYTKRNLPEYMYDYDLLNINHCGLTNTILRHHNVNRFNYNECEKLSNQLLT